MFSLARRSLNLTRTCNFASKLMMCVCGLPKVMIMMCVWISDGFRIDCVFFFSGSTLLQSRSGECLNLTK